MFYPDSCVLVFFEIAQVHLRLADCGVHQGHLQNEQDATERTLRRCDCGTD